MTQNNICQSSWKADSVAVGDWSFDEHMTGKYAVPDPSSKSGYSVMLEGNFWPSIAAGCPGGGGAGGGPNAGSNKYDVPYSIMTPKKGTGANLLVPVALSASAVAYSSTRIESMFMYVGTAAGVAAQQVVAGTAATVQEVNVTEVQRLLTSKFHQIIHINGSSPSPPSPPAGPTPAYYNVTGAGTAAYNGQYRRQGATPTAETSLRYTSTNAACEGCAIYTLQGVWRIAVNGKELGYVAPGVQPALPPVVGWTACPNGSEQSEAGATSAPCNGVSPAPALIAGPTN